MIHFENQPKLSEYSVDQDFNERRKELLSEVENFLATDPFFAGQELSVKFSQEGVSSLVSFITTQDGTKYVLKVPLAKSAEGEAEFLKAWEKVGVSVPRVFQEGKIGGHPYILMSFIDAQVVERGPKFSYEAGVTFSKMHKAKARGYGAVVNGKAEFESFTDWIQSPGLAKRIQYVRDEQLLSEEHGSLEDAVLTLIEYCERNPESVYCHFDFGTYNLINTEPPTVIDPSPMFNNPIMDISRSMVLEISGGGSGESLIEGYCSDGRVLEEKALRAAILINACWKFNYWNKKGYTGKMDKVREYLRIK